MAKRFTDTDKWKKPYIRGLQGAYKLLWLYILDDCDHAGIWQVDFEVASIRIGEQVNEKDAIEAFGERIEIFNDGTKWFIVDFVDFQYGPLSEKNRMHLSVINILTKNQVGAYKPLTRGQGYGQGQGISQGQGEGEGQGCDPVIKNFDLTFENAFDEITCDRYKMVYKDIDLGRELQLFRIKCDNDKKTYYGRDVAGLRTAFQYQLKTAKKNGTKQNNTDSLIRGFAERYGHDAGK